jgi:hypothetical protein
MNKYIENFFKKGDNTGDIMAALTTGASSVRNNHDKKLAFLTRLLDILANKLANIR